MTQYKITVDGKEWTTNSNQASYDASQFIAGAVLAGAENIKVKEVND